MPSDLFAAQPRTFLHSLAAAVGALAAVALGLSAGAMLAEGGLLVPWWRSLPGDVFLRWYAENASRLVDFFGPLEIAATLPAVLAAALYRYQRRAARGWFVLSALLAVAVLLSFPLYFQQVNASFADGSIGAENVAAELGRWATWHWSRVAIGIAAFGAAVLGVRASAGG